MKNVAVFGAGRINRACVDEGVAAQKLADAAAQSPAGDQVVRL